MNCADHPQVEATRECTRCGRWRCDGCVKKVKAGTGELEVCVTCGGVLRVAERVVAGPSEALVDDVRRPFGVLGIASAVAIAVPAWLSSFPSMGILRVIYFSGISAIYFQIVDHVGQGREGMPAPSDAIEDFVGLMGQILRGVLCFGMAFLPLALFVFLVPGALHELDPRHALPLGILLLLGLAIVPGSILAVVLSRSVFGAIWPLAWYRIIERAPASYLRLVGLFVVSAVAWILVSAIATGTVGRIPIVGELVSTTATNLVVFIQAAIVGGFIRRNAPAFGYD